MERETLKRSFQSSRNPPAISQLYPVCVRRYLLVDRHLKNPTGLCNYETIHLSLKARADGTDEICCPPRKCSRISCLISSTCSSIGRLGPRSQDGGGGGQSIGEDPCQERFANLSIVSMIPMSFLPSGERHEVACQQHSGW